MESWSTPRSAGQTLIMTWQLRMQEQVVALCSRFPSCSDSHVELGTQAWSCWRYHSSLSGAVLLCSSGLRT